MSVLFAVDNFREHKEYNAHTQRYKYLCNIYVDVVYYAHTYITLLYSVPHGMKNAIANDFSSGVVNIIIYYIITFFFSFFFYDYNSPFAALLATPETARTRTFLSLSLVFAERKKNGFFISIFCNGLKKSHLRIRTLPSIIIVYTLLRTFPSWARLRNRWNTSLVTIHIMS